MSFFDRVHWPQAILLCFTAASLVAGPIAFFALVPERIVDKLLDLPWSTIATFAVVTIVPAISACVSPWLRPVVARDHPDSKGSPS